MWNCPICVHQAVPSFVLRHRVHLKTIWRLRRLSAIVTLLDKEVLLEAVYNIAFLLQWLYPFRHLSVARPVISRQPAINPAFSMASR